MLVLIGASALLWLAEAPTGVALGFQQVPGSGAEGLLLVYVTPRFVTVNAVCLRQEACEQQVRAALQGTPGIGKIMAYRPQGAMMVDYDGKRITPEHLTGVVTKAMAGEPVRWTPTEVRYTGSRKVPNKLVAHVGPGRVTLVSERFL